LVYRTVCPVCADFIELPEDAFKYRSGIGAGRDIDGSYESGFSETTVKCTTCGKTSLMKTGTIGDKIKNKELGFATHFNR
jgi:hypothetical protein